MEDKTYVYIVYECEGSYEDYWEHAVKGFYSEEKAKQFAKELDDKHEELTKYPLEEYDHVEFMQELDEIQWSVSELPDFDKENPYDYSDQENYNRWREEDEKKYNKKCYETLIKIEKYKNLSFDDFMKFIQWYDYYQLKQYNSSKVEKVEIEN